MKIGPNEIGPDAPLFLVAELGVTACGSVSRAKALIDAVAYAGCDAAKFIVTDPDKIMSSRDVMFSYETLADRKTRPLYDLLHEMRFTPAEWVDIAAYCKARNVIFFATADHLDAVNLLEVLDVPAHKCSAWDITWLPLIQAMRATGKPVLIDVGTATRDETLAALPDDPNLLFVHAPHPHGDQDWNMSRLCQFFHRDYPIGFSSPGRDVWPDYMALGGGACLLEKRLTLKRDEPTGHHHAVSLEPDEFREWVMQMRRADVIRREDAFSGTHAAWAERARFNRNEKGLQP